MDKVKIGILGCANIANRYVLPALKENKHFKVVAVASRDQNKAEDFGRKFQCKPVLGYANLLEEDIDAVYIPLPNSLHYKWIKESINHGKHVLVEKSMGISYSEVNEINRLAKNNKLLIMEHFQFRRHKQMFKIKELLDTYAIGDLRSISSAFCFPPFPDKNNIRYKKELGGGALLDAGAYPIKISQIILGNNIKVTSAKLFYDEEKGIDLWGSAFIESNASAVCSKITFGFDNHYQCNVEILGSKGKITVDRIFTSPTGSEAKVILETNSVKEEIIIPKDNHFINFHNYFYDLVKTGNFSEEYEQNKNQARLIQELRNVSNE